MNLKYSVLLAMTSLLLASCSAPVASKFASPDPGSGYIYGIFELPKPDRNCSFGANFILREIGTAQERVIAFSGSEPVSVFPIPPGRYQIKQFVVKNCSSLEADRKDFTSPIVGTIEVKPMTALYIGNYAARTYIAPAFNGVAVNMVFLSRLCRDFPVTTEKFRMGWPNLSTLQAVDATTGGTACIRPVS
jgi:hypothetical protein